uniref:Uncharacterized protein n=1 Tax=Setaria viridis TaxID=4556 RepID=A0A4U6USL1_SETVI|nr:hypothetical protein SEVIR_5G140400v2 [Setaria viridis]
MEEAVCHMHAIAMLLAVAAWRSAASRPLSETVCRRACWESCVLLLHGLFAYLLSFVPGRNTYPAAARGPSSCLPPPHLRLFFPRNPTRRPSPATSPPPPLFPRLCQARALARASSSPPATPTPCSPPPPQRRPARRHCLPARSYTSRRGCRSPPPPPRLMSTRLLPRITPLPRRRPNPNYPPVTPALAASLARVLAVGHPLFRVPAIVQRHRRRAGTLFLHSFFVASEES